MKCKKLLCMLLAALMLLGLTACGNKPSDPNLLKVGDYTLLYKGAEIMPDDSGNDSIVLTLDFTNNSKDSGAYLLSVRDSAKQNGTDLEYAVIYTSPDSYDEVIDGQFTEVAPGETIELKSAFVLIDTTSKVEVTFEEVFGTKKATLTIDPSTLTKSSSGIGGEKDGDSDGDDGEDPAVSEPGGPSAEALRDWWNGDWYGWWIMTGCWGNYEDMEGMWWDLCGTIDIGEDNMGTVILWDEDYTESEPMAAAAVSLSELGTGEFGTLMSEDGWFTDITLEHADWIVDPGLAVYPDMVHIDGYYENGDDEFTYDIYLRPWGSYWDDVAEEQLPGLYDDWYLPLIEAGEPMPDSIG